jgi:hypothetical protein
MLTCVYNYPYIKLWCLVITWPTEKVKAYDKLFVINSRMVNAWLYSNDVGIVQFMSINNMGCLINFLVNKKLVWMGWLTTIYF